MRPGAATPYRVYLRANALCPAVAVPFLLRINCTAVSAAIAPWRDGTLNLKGTAAHIDRDVVGVRVTGHERGCTCAELAGERCAGSAAR